jgi:hypothetical protein
VNVDNLSLIKNIDIMKSIKKIMLLLVVSSIPLMLNAQIKNSKKSVLELTGSALLNNTRTSDYSISVYLDGRIIDSMYTKSKKTIKFYVDYNQVYTILFQKENCMDKIVIVNTKIPHGLKSLEDDTFDFEVEMSQSLAKSAKELEDYPVAVLYIDKKNEVLQASTEYNKFTHSNAEVITTKVSQEKQKNKSDK